jgi:hypothetical protein
MAIPTPYLGTQYVVAGYGSFNQGTFASEFSLIGTQDTTFVTIRLNADTRNGMPTGRTVSLYLNKGETIQWQGTNASNSNDLTGTTIIANKPIACVTGHQCAQVPVETRYCDALMEMEPPAKDFGRDFVLTSLAIKSSYTARVIAAFDSTELVMNGVRIAYMDKGAYAEIARLDHDVHLTTSQPVLVAEYATSSEADRFRIGDPFMFFVTPRNRFTNEFTTTSVTTGQYRHFLNVVVSLRGLASLKLDGTTPFPNGKDTTTAGQPSPNEASFTPVRPLENTDLVVATLEVRAGRHAIECDEPMAVYSFGFGIGTNMYDSYGHSCGQHLDAQ